MRVRVLLFARARDLAGRDSVEVELPAETTVKELRARVANELPGLAGFVGRCAVALAGEYAAETDVVREGAEVAVIPPVSGGCGAEAGRLVGFERGGQIFRVDPAN
jgi:molybdopterin converting factor subunit 1